jgi:hypothetical protein
MSAALAAGYNLPDPEPFLVVLTDTNTATTDRPVLGRLVWLIRYANLSIVGPVPVAENGAAPTIEPFHFAYLVIDAHTGELLIATYRT